MQSKQVTDMFCLYYLSTWINSKKANAKTGCSNSL